MKPVWPEQYHSNPNPDKPIEEIWDDLDGYSFEELYEQPSHQNDLRFQVPFPPMYYQGRFIKGICYTQGAHLLIEQFPQIKKLFFVCANSMCFAYPWSRKADCFFACYDNPPREKYHKEKHPETRKIIFLPLQDADFTNDKVMKPVSGGFRSFCRRLLGLPQKTIDVFCVSTSFPVKNLPMIAKALKAYESKYGRRLKVVFAIGDADAKKRKDGSLDYSGVSDYGKEALIAVDKILGDTKAYIDFHPYINYHDLPKYYSNAKCGVLASLIEGKNRFLSEGMCCDMPVIVFKDHNKFARGEHPVFFGNSGEYAPEFTPESLADTIHKVITNQAAYAPRQNFLKHSGRRIFINMFVRAIPYYRKNLPQLETGDVLQNDWLKRACLNNYGIDFEDFLYDERSDLSHASGLDDISSLLQYYCAKFDMPWREVPAKRHKPLQ